MGLLRGYQDGVCARPGLGTWERLEGSGERRRPCDVRRPGVFRVEESKSERTCGVRRADVMVDDETVLQWL